MLRRTLGHVLLLALCVLLGASLLAASDTIWGQALPPATRAPSPTPSLPPAAAPALPVGISHDLATLLPARVAPQGMGTVGGHGFTLRSDPAAVNLAWQVGSAQTGYLVIRWSPEHGFA